MEAGETPRLKNALNVFVEDTEAPVITGVDNNSIYTSAVTPVIIDENLSVVAILKDGSKIAYEKGMALTEDGEYTIIAMDNGNNKTTVTFTIKTTVPSTEETPNTEVNSESQDNFVGITDTIEAK